MNYHELVQMYFERSVALQWYWTIYILVIGGILGFSTFRLRPDVITTILVTVLYACFAYKNLGAIEDTTREREAILAALKEVPLPRDPVPASAAADIQRVRQRLEPTLQPSEFEGFTGIRNFHLMCNLVTIAVVWVKEWRRRQYEPGAAPTA
jgi:hypothetical protein